jgi:cephalosporin-C deacetylase-like acetyl esterase
MKLQSISLHTKWIGRWLLLCLFLDISVVSGQEDLRWQVTPNVNDLDDFNVEPNSPALAKALGDAAEYVLRWRLPGSAEDWKLRRPQVHKALLRIIGLEPLPPRTPLNARVVATHDLGDYSIENVIFESRPRFPVTANLYRPKAPAEGKRAAILCPIGHILDAGKASREVQSRCIKLARMGFVVLAYDAIGQGERLISGNIHHEAGYALFPVGETIAGWMAWDSMRAIDYLESLPEVDPDRIGVTGNSGGGLATLYTAALDNRVAAAAVSGYTFQFNTWMKYAGAHGTCSQLPGLYRAMEWFEIAGLIAPRPLLMLQGERDADFPISAARKAGRSAEALYALLGHQGLARFDMVPKQPHAYSQPYRERMYGWMALHLLGQGNGNPLPEGEIEPLPENDPRLRCDLDGSLIARSASVVELARERAEKMIAGLPSTQSPGRLAAVRRWAEEFTAPPDREPHNLMPRSFGKTSLPWGILEKVYFVSEIGQHIPGLLWLPKGSGGPKRTIILVDDRGKAAVAESGLVQPLVEAGFAVLSVDLRGRGETLGRIGTSRNNNYHFVQHSIMWGRPVAGRRAFDLKRTIDFVQYREDLPDQGVVLVGLGDEALPALLAAATDSRIERLVCSGYVTSFASQMIAASLPSRAELLREWNRSAMRWGRLHGASYDVDLGSVIPSVLETTDIPELVSLVAPRKVLYCQTRDHAVAHRSRLERGEDWLTYQPEKTFDSQVLLSWLAQ